MEIPAEPAVIATGPLTDGALMRNIESLLGDSLHFFDAAAPIVTLESLDMNRISRASRYGRGSDYLNCPMTMREYYEFVRALVSAETAPLHEFETVNVFEGCMPVEVMAKRGDLTLAYGPLKPVGLAECTASDGKNRLPLCSSDRITPRARFLTSWDFKPISGSASRSAFSE